MNANLAHSHRGLYVTICAIFCACCTNLHAGLSAGDVLDSCDGALGAAKVWSMRVEVSASWRQSTAPDLHGPAVVFVANYLRDGNRRDIESLTPESGKYGPDDRLDAAVGLRHRAILNGYFIAYDTPMKGSRRAPVYSAAGEKFVTVALRKTMGFETALEGRLADPDRVTDILRHAIDTRVSDPRGIVDGQPCVMVVGASRFGTYTLWCDPGVGFLPRKIMVVKTGADLYGTLRVSDTRLRAPSGKMLSLTTLTYTADSMKFQKFGDTTLPISCHVSERYDFADRSWHVREMTVIREAVNLHPDLKKNPKAFEPNLVDGTALSNQDNLQLPYEWRGGKPVPRVSQSTIEHVNKTADEYRAK